jgi:hypothetical protein
VLPTPATAGGPSWLDALQGIAGIATPSVCLAVVHRAHCTVPNIAPISRGAGAGSSMPGAAVKHVSTAVWAPAGVLQWLEVALQ